MALIGDAPVPPGAYSQGDDGTWYNQDGDPIDASGAPTGGPKKPGWTPPTSRTGSPSARLPPVGTNTPPPPSGDTQADPGTHPGGASGRAAAPPGPPAAIPPFSGVTYPGFTPPPLPDALRSPFRLPTADELVANDPGYMSRYQLGQKSIERSAASRGTVLNPGTLQALQQAGQDYASNEYNTYVNQKLGERNQQSSDYLNLAYGPSWQTNSAAVNQYGQLYKQYGDLITNNRNAQNDYIDQLIRQQGIGVNAAGAPPTSSTSNV